MNVEFISARYGSAEKSVIICECLIDGEPHVYATADGTGDDAVQEMWHRVQASGVEISPYVPPTIQEKRESAFATKAAIASAMIADNPAFAPELEAWVLSDTIPDRVDPIFSGLSLQERSHAKKMDVIWRNSPLIAPFAAVYGYTTDAQIDTLFGIS